MKPYSPQFEREIFSGCQDYLPRICSNRLIAFRRIYGLADNSSLRKMNQQCIEDSRHYVKALWNQSQWASSSIYITLIILNLEITLFSKNHNITVYHSSGRLWVDESTNFLIMAGLGINVHQDPGLFDQCISTSSPSGRIRGQYC